MKFWVNPNDQVPERFRWDKNRARNWVLAYIDNQGLDIQVTLVAASGFFADSYSLFATNIILPSLAYIYWPYATNNQPELVINCVTLAGSACGQAFFGYLADKYGRRKLYGVELIIVIFGTLGMAQASTGTNKSMSILGWIIFWRFFMGIGIGAEYPLSAVITAEFASTKYRAVMMACVFMMQPLGQICAAAVGWGVLTSLVKSRGLDNLPIHGADLSDQQKFDIISTLDSVWRCVVAVGTIPVLVAIIFRLSIPESPRYTMDVQDDGIQAFYDIRGHRGLETTEENAVDEIGERSPERGPPAEQRERQGTTPNQFTLKKLREYFITEGNLTWLSATSGCWFMLDFAFYGLSIDNPRRIAAIWAPSYPNSSDFQTSIDDWPSPFPMGNSTTVYSNASIPDWENPFDINTNIYQELFGNTFRYVMTICIGSLIGSLCMITFIDRLGRRGWLIISFLILALLFIIMGVSLQAVEFQPAYPVTIGLYIICQFFFNFGPNTLTFIIPAEIFPTKYRATCYGISAAFGKLGALAVQGVLSRKEFTTDPTQLRIAFLCFAIPMTLGAVFALGWLPSLQEPPRPAYRTCEIPTIPSKRLETLAQGRAYATGPAEYYPPGHEFEGGLVGGGEVLTFVGKLSDIWNGVVRGGNGRFARRRDSAVEMRRPANPSETSV